MNGPFLELYNMIIKRMDEQDDKVEEHIKTIVEKFDEKDKEQDKKINKVENMAIDTKARFSTFLKLFIIITVGTGSGYYLLGMG